MKRWQAIFIIGAFIAIQGLFVGAFCADPYPCSASGIGCHDVWEMLSDSWSSYYMGFSLIIGFATIFKGVNT